MELARSFFTQVGSANRSATAGFTDQELATAHQVMSAITDAMDRFRPQLDATD